MRSFDVPFSSRVPVAGLAAMFRQARARCKRKRAQRGMRKIRKTRKTRATPHDLAVSHCERLIEEPQGDPELAAEYLKAAAAHGESARVPHRSFDRSLCKLPTSLSCGVSRAFPPFSHRGKGQLLAMFDFRCC